VLAVEGGVNAGVEVPDVHGTVTALSTVSPVDLLRVDLWQGDAATMRDLLRTSMTRSRKDDTHPVTGGGDGQ